MKKIDVELQIGEHQYVKQIKPTNEFPLVIQFQIEHEAIETQTMQAGFRNWDHWKAYASQMFDRNGVKCRHPVQVSVLQ